jgi:cytochrome c-type biogenesis protein CcmH
MSGESHLDWLLIRRRELAEEPAETQQQLELDAELRLLDEGVVGSAESTEVGTASRSTRWLSAVVVIVVLLLPTLLYWQLGALEDLRITRALENLEGSSPEAFDALIRDIEARSSARPGNVEYLSLLGEYYTAQNNHLLALETYEALLEQFPQSPELLARAAQAEYLSGERTLSAQARTRAEAALAIDPRQRSALGTLGIAAFEASDYALAVQYWERLLITENPGTPGYQMLSRILAEARQRGGLEAGENVSPSGPVPGSVGVDVLVSAPLGAAVTGTVFVLARPAGSEQRMPVAVVRRDATDLPLKVRLDDASSMAGQKVSTLAALDIEVQVSPSGQPGLDNAAWWAGAESVSASESAAISLELAPRTP